MKKKITFILTLILMFTLVAQSSFAYAFSSNSPYTGETYQHNDRFSDSIVVNGIDVSQWQGTINWEKVKADGIDFAIIRAGGRFFVSGDLYFDDNFYQNIKAAQESGLPLIVHNRNSDEDMIRLLREAYDRKPFKGIIHCYSSSWALAKAALEMGFYISASGMITFNNAAELRANFAKVPNDRLLVETDAPYLAPVPKRGQVNEPANVVFTTAKLAEIKQIDFAQAAQMTTDNFKRLFEL